MTDFNLGTGAEGPINRTGAPDTQIEGMDTQATLVGFKDDGSGNYQLVEADAGAEANGGGEVPVAGVFFQEQVIDMEDTPSGMFLQDLEEQLVAENKTIKGDRGTFIFDGVEMVNNDDDTSFTPGEPVYLDVGGGFTQTPPSVAGDIVQVLGVCVPPNEDAGVGTTQGDRVILNVDWAYDNA